MTPERVNCLAKVNKILSLTNQQQSLLLELYSERFRVLYQSHSMKQFELGITKVRGSENNYSCVCVCVSTALLCRSCIGSSLKD